MYVVEYDVNNSLDVAAGRLQLTRRVRRNRCAGGNGNAKSQSAQTSSQLNHRSLL
jgi:hypothetical protein